MRLFRVLGLSFAMLTFAVSLYAGTGETTGTLTVAVFDLEAKDKALQESGAILADFIRLRLGEEPKVRLVTREELNSVLKEQSLGVAGITDAQAPRVGALLGAQVLVLGRVFNTDASLVATVKVVGVETGRVFSEMAKGSPREIEATGKDLGTKVDGMILKGAGELVAKVSLNDKQIAELKEHLGKNARPRVYVHVREQVVGSQPPDPAAQTEIEFILKKVGCEVVKDSDKSLGKWCSEYFAEGDKIAPPRNADVDVIFIGEGLSQFASRTGDLVSCRARVELTALDVKSGKVLSVDRETFTGVDLAEQIAAKTALEKTAARLALRVLPEAIKAWNPTPPENR
jgi:hypothetical protein